MGNEQGSLQSVQISYTFPELSLNLSCNIEFPKTDFNQSFSSRMRQEVVTKDLLSQCSVNYLEIIDEKGKVIGVKVTILQACERYKKSGVVVRFVGIPENLMEPQYAQRLLNFEKTIWKRNEILETSRIANSERGERILQDAQTITLELSRQYIDIMYSETIPISHILSPSSEEENMIEVSCDLGDNVKDSDEFDIVVSFSDRVGHYQLLARFEGDQKEFFSGNKISTDPSICMTHVRLSKASSRKFKFLMKADMVPSLFICRNSNPSPVHSLLACIKLCSQEMEGFISHDLLQKIDWNLLCHSRSQNLHMFNSFYIQTRSDVYKVLTKDPKAVQTAVMEICGEFLGDSSALLVLEYCGIKGKIGFELSDFGWEEGSSEEGVIFSCSQLSRRTTNSIRMILFRTGLCVMEIFCEGPNQHILDLYIGHYVWTEEKENNICFDLKHFWNAEESERHSYHLTYGCPALHVDNEVMLEGNINAKAGTLETARIRGPFSRKVNFLYEDQQGQNWKLSGKLCRLKEDEFSTKRPISPFLHLLKFWRSNYVVE
jgi:hypothetical protein